MKKPEWIVKELKKIGLSKLKFNLEIVDGKISSECDNDGDTNTISISKYVDSSIGKLARLVGGRPMDVKHSYRHELGHAFLYSIYDVTDHKRFLNTFGDADEEYDDNGVYKCIILPHDDDYVSKYAQTHAEEDFAETFAEYMETGGLVYEEDSKEVERKKKYIEHLIEKVWPVYS